MDLTMAIGAGLYMITCSVSNKIYIGQTECVLYRVGRHANELVKNKHTDYPEMQNDFNTHGPESFRFQVLDVDSPQLNEKQYRIEREKEELQKYPSFRLYNKPIGIPVIARVQRVKINGVEYDTIREAVNKTNYSKTDMIRKLNGNEIGFERLEQIPIKVKRSDAVVIKGVVYPNITTAVKICRMHFNTIKKYLNHQNDKSCQYYDEALHWDLPHYEEHKLN